MVSNKSGGGPARPIVFSGGLSNEQRIDNENFKNTAAGKAYPDLIEGAKQKAAREAQDVEGKKRRAKTAKKKKDKLESLFPDMAKPKPKTGKAKKKAKQFQRILSMSNSVPGSRFEASGDDDTEERAAKSHFHHDVAQQLEVKSSLDSDSEGSDGSEMGGDDSQDEAEMEDSASERDLDSSNDPASKREGAQVGEAEKKESGSGTAVAAESPASKPAAPSAVSPLAAPAASSPPESGCCVIC